MFTKKQALEQRAAPLGSATTNYLDSNRLRKKGSKHALIGAELLMHFFFERTISCRLLRLYVMMSRTYTEHCLRGRAEKKKGGVKYKKVNSNIRAFDDCNTQYLYYHNTLNFSKTCVVAVTF